jgi:predicted small lipoprotein YifL
MASGHKVSAVRAAPEALLLLCALLACGRKAPVDTERQATPAAASSAPVAAPDAGREPVILASAATFKKDKLIACADLAVVSPRLETAATKQDAGIVALIEDDARVFVAGGDSWIADLIDAKHGKGKAAALGVGGEPQVASGPCGEQFAGRAVLASCTVQIMHRSDAGPPDRIGLQLHHYDAMASDKALRACMAVHGKWMELPKNSLQFRNQKHHQMFDEALPELDPE